MAFSVKIDGAANIKKGDQRTLKAVVTPDGNDKLPAGVTYDWKASHGSFVGASNGATVVYRADVATTTDVSVTITCTVTVPGNPNPTVASPSLTSLDDLGITGAVVNMLVTPSSNLVLFTTNAIAAGSDANFESNLAIGIVYNLSYGQKISIYRNGSSGNFSTWWTKERKSQYSVYFIFNDGRVLEVPGDTLTLSASLMTVPINAGADRSKFNAIKNGHKLLIAVADKDSIGLPGASKSATASFTVTGNAPPEVTITAPSRLNPGETADISVATRDPEGTAVTVSWEASAGTVKDKTAKATRFTAPADSGDVTLRCTGRDANGHTTTATHIIVINSPPVINITAAPSILEIGQVGKLTAEVSDPNSDAVTVKWQTTEGTIAGSDALTTSITAPNSPATITVTCTATDAFGLQATATVDITVVQNLDPTLSINVPASIIASHEADLTATVGDPTGDTVTVLWETTKGSIANPTSETATLTAPPQPGTITVKCTATDEHGAQVSKSAKITVVENAPPTLAIEAPKSLITGREGMLVATAMDPTSDPVSVLWETTGGTIADATAAATTITAPLQPGTITITCTATDAYGASTVKTADIVINLQNRPPTVRLKVPPAAKPGQTVRIEAVITDADGDATTGIWSTPSGQIAQPTNKVTTIKLPMQVGVYPLSYKATDDMGAAASQTTYITVGDPNKHIYTPVVRIEIEGVDVTDRWIQQDGLNMNSQLDYAEVFKFRSGGTQFNVDNEDGYFDYSNPQNFFLTHGLPAHGRGAKVLIQMGLSENDLLPAFAGELSEVITSLSHTKAGIKARDLSVKLRHRIVKNFGQTLTRRITDFDGANADYDELDPIFYFPKWGRPIVRGSVKLTVHEGNGDVDINVVNVLSSSGILSNRNAEIDYKRGLIRFELPPEDGAATEITAEWKIDYRYKRPDYLIRQLLKHSGHQTRLGIADDKTARFAIEQSLISHPTEVFSSHGRPYPQEHGVVRWLHRHVPADGNPIWSMVQDERFIEYDEYQDEYKQVSELPKAGGLKGIVNADYGSYLSQESFRVNDLSNPKGIARDGNRIYILDSYTIRVFLLDGTEVTSASITLARGRQISPNNYPYAYTSIAVRNDRIYVGRFYRSSGIRSFGGTALMSHSIIVLDKQGTVLDTHSIYSLRTSSLTRDGSIALTDTRIFYSMPDQNRLYILDYDGKHQTSENATFRATAIDTGRTIAVNDTHLYAHASREAKMIAVTLAGVRDEAKDFDIQEQIANSGGGADTTSTRFYTVHDKGTYAQVYVYHLGVSVDFGGYVPYQFDTTDNDVFYFLAANNTQGNALSASALRRVKVYKYVKSTNTWTDLLNEGKGQPQLSHAYKFPGEAVIYVADNRKMFRALLHNNKRLVFFRRAQATRSGIAYLNDGNGTVTNVYTENHNGTKNYGLPYSMDFALDVRNDGIYVYTFVVRHHFDSSRNYSGGSLKVYRKRVEPAGTQTQIFAETFVQIVDEEDYPVSVSDIILADDRSKFYFVLDFHGEGNRPGKAELCTIAKSGSGRRTVLKTYNNPLIGARSPVKMGSRYFYLEGGWARRPKDNPADVTLPHDQHHYPNEGGRLIEIKTDDTITDHGRLWRSATKADSPNPDTDDMTYDSWGLHNAVISNMIADDRDGLHFIAGYGSPYNVNENLPFSSNRNPIPALSNYPWLTWGKDLPTKIASFHETDIKVWDAIQDLARLTGWEVGFRPNVRKVEAIQAAQPSLTNWAANASLFFRPRTVLPARLRNSVSASANLSTFSINDSGLPAEIAEFPAPAAGERYAVIIDKELFTYNSVKRDAKGHTFNGVQRAQHGSVRAAHTIGSAVYFVDYFASGEIGTTLVSIQSRSLDFVNVKNEVNVTYGGTSYTTDNQRSIDEHDNLPLTIDNALLNRHDKAWSVVIGDLLLKELSVIKEQLQFTLVFSPTLQPGQLVVVYQSDRLWIDFKKYRLVKVVHYTHPRWRTVVTANEIIDK